MDKKLMTISTSMMILKFLDEKEMYGYQIIQELERRSEKVFELKEGTLYPILHGLLLSGSVDSFEKVADTGRIRKYYRITKKGRKLLAEKENEWNTYQRAVNQVMGGGQVYEGIRIG